MDKKKTYFSGIQPSGNLHIGNYLGAINQWVNLQEVESESDFIFCIVDLHAITTRQESLSLKNKIREMAALYLACGIDTKNAHIFIQSENFDHSYLAWLLDCITPQGWLNRMTQYKDKSEKQKEGASMGLYNYPVLMASDILLYDTDIVPVGEDQIQHVELTRDIAEKFNKNYKEIFKLPKVKINKNTARIMSLQNPKAKMSKSDSDPLGTINILDSKDEISNKFKRAITDSGSDIKFQIDKPAISNLLSIYSGFSSKSIEEIEKEYLGKNYSHFKNDLAEIVINYLSPIQEKFNNLLGNKDELNTILDNGRQYSTEKSSKKIKSVIEAMGLGR
jgi:tryptophanyl-tRNA synthetase